MLNKVSDVKSRDLERRDDEPLGFDRPQSVNTIGTIAHEGRAEQERARDIQGGTRLMSI